MPAIDPARLRKIQRASRELRLLFIVLVVLGVLTKLARPNPHGAKVVIAGIIFQGASLTGKVHILWIVQHVLGAAIGLWIFYHLVRLLGLYSQGRIFTAQNVAFIRRIGLSLFCFPLVWLVGLIGAAPEIAAAQTQWTQILPSFPFNALIEGAVILFAGWIMNEGRELREEQDLVV
jgi:Protein of unknown function (DUF2975)